MYIPHICGADVHFIIFDWELFDLMNVYRIAMCYLCLIFLGLFCGALEELENLGSETERRQAGLHTAEVPEIWAREILRGQVVGCGKIGMFFFQGY